MQKQKNKKNYEIEVPIYSYAKKILQKQFGEYLDKNTNQYDFFVAAGNLYAPMFQVAKKELPSNSNNISKIEMLQINLLLPNHTIRLLSLYRKEDIAYSLATILNKQAKGILNAVVEFNFTKHSKKTTACEEAFNHFGITPEDLDMRKYIDRFYS